MMQKRARPIVARATVATALLAAVAVIDVVRAWAISSDAPMPAPLD
jgi:hypothetical protein